MSQKLEDRLHLYERDHPIRDDQELISALEAILEEQDELPVENRDFDLISEATDAILHLRGYSDEQLSDMADAAVDKMRSSIYTNNHAANKSHFSSNHYKSRLTWIIFAVIVATIAITSVSASLIGFNILEATRMECCASAPVC